MFYYLGPFYLIIDETTDVKQRQMCAILAGVLDSNSTLKKPFLIELIDLECTNSSSISPAINKCLFDLFDGVIPYKIYT